MASHKLLTLLMCCLLPLAAHTIPIQRNKRLETSPALCTTRINHAYNIGPDCFLAPSSRAIFRFKYDDLSLSEQQYSNDQLFGKQKFSWVDTVISLHGFCKQTGYCADGDTTWNDVELVHIAIGRLASSRVYGASLFVLDNDRLVPLDPANDGLHKKLATIGIEVDYNKLEGTQMIGDFWPKIENIYVKSAMFVPHRGEIYFSVYDSKNPASTKQLLSRKLRAGSSQPWRLVSTELAGSNFNLNLDFPAMFTIGPKAFGMDQKNLIYEFMWKDELKFAISGELKDVFNCNQNSAIIKELLLDKSDPIENVVEAMSSSKAPPPTTTTTTTTTTESPKHLEMEKEMEQSSTEKPSMHDHMDHNSITSTSAELRELSVSPSAIESKGGDEEEDELNDISHQHDDPNQHLRNSLAEASARGPFHPQDDGLLWTFGILIAVLVILTVIILIPILIIRHRSRSSRMNIYKKPNKPTNTSSNSEEVQLMNSSQIEK